MTEYIKQAWKASYLCSECGINLHLFLVGSSHILLCPICKRVFVKQNPKSVKLCFIAKWVTEFATTVRFTSQQELLDCKACPCGPQSIYLLAVDEQEEVRVFMCQCCWKVIIIRDEKINHTFQAYSLSHLLEEKVRRCI